MPSQKTTSIEIKQINRNNIYHYLYENKAPMSKQSIAHALDISFPTVCQNVKELIDQGLIIETGAFDSTGGRKAKAIVFNNDARFSIGLDVTRNHIGIVVINLAGRIIRTERLKFPFSHTDAYFKAVSNLIERFIMQAALDRTKIIGVGIAVPAIVSEDRQHLTYSSVLGNADIRLNDFAKFIKFPCVFCNDANAAGFAETWDADLKNNAVYLSLNNTVGGSILMGNVISFGNNQRCGEFGHMTIIPEGRVCYCGKKGCVDPYCSARILSDSTDGNLRLFFDLLRKEGKQQVKIWNEYLYYLSLTLNNLRMIFDCDVIIGGYVGAYMNEYIGRLSAMAAERNTFERDGSYLRVCNYQLEATAVGVALYYVNEFLQAV
jgi:Transcriptional regulator/sugar kinase